MIGAGLPFLKHKTGFIMVSSWIGAGLRFKGVCAHPCLGRRVRKASDCWTPACSPQTGSLAEASCLYG